MFQAEVLLCSLLSASTGISRTVIEQKGMVKFPPNSEIPNSSCSSSKPSHLNQTENSSSRDNSDTHQLLTSKLGNVKLDNNFASTRNNTSSAPYKPEKWMMGDQKQGVLNQLNLAIVRNSLG